MRLATLVLTPIIMFVSGSALARNDATRKANDALFLKMKDALGLTDSELDKVRQVFKRNDFISQGNPEASMYALSKAECLNRKTAFDKAEFRAICKSPYMAPLYDPKKDKAADAAVCIDQFEFPSIPCEYPVVWTKTIDADAICKAVGKRLCDTHEWEGACAGRLKPPDYKFDLVKPTMSMKAKHEVLRKAHNPGREVLWSYGPKKDHKLCATGSVKSKACSMDSKVAEWTTCGSNYYPAGAFPECKSSLGVYDLHGNAAEAMNIPFQPEEMTSAGGLGYTELKGSWYIFSSYEAHVDDCRWRAPFWHGDTVEKSFDQHNHLGFRCCKDIK